MGYLLIQFAFNRALPIRVGKEGYQIPAVGDQPEVELYFADLMALSGNFPGYPLRPEVANAAISILRNPSLE